MKLLSIFTERFMICSQNYEVAIPQKKIINADYIAIFIQRDKVTILFSLIYISSINANLYTAQILVTTFISYLTTLVFSNYYTSFFDFDKTYFLTILYCLTFLL